MLWPLLTVTLGGIWPLLWQYGLDVHASDVCSILGSISLQATTDYVTVASITHVILDGTSQWVSGQKFTDLGDVRYLCQSRLVIPDGTGNSHRIATVEYYLHQYLPISIILPDGSSSPISAHVVTTWSAAATEISPVASTTPPHVLLSPDESVHSVEHDTKILNINDSISNDVNDVLNSFYSTTIGVKHNRFHEQTTIAH